MDTVILIMISIFFVSAVLIAVVLYGLSKAKKGNYKKQLDKLEVEKNLLDSVPIIPELAKIESYLNNEKLEAMYNNWKDRLDVIRSNQIPKITDMLLEADYTLSQRDYKSTIYKIAKLEMEIYKVRTNSDFLLNEIKEITSSEERNRTMITKLKALYRELYEKFVADKLSFGEMAEPVELQFENIAKRFEDFEAVMESNEFTEVTNIINAIDDMLKHMKNVIEELPNIILLCTNVLPKKIAEVQEEYNEMVKQGYPLDYLNIEYNIEEANKKISDIYDRGKVLNLEDSLFELKVLTEYFDSVFTDYEKEKVDKNSYEEVDRIFQKKLNKLNRLMKEIFDQLDDIKSVYNLSEENLNVFIQVDTELKQLNEDYKILIDHTSNNTFAFSKLAKEIETLSNKISILQEKVDNVLDSISTMRDDEVRARQQLEEIKLILKDSKIKIKEYNLPIIPQNYFVELNEAQLAIKEIIKELDKKPITIDILNTRVDTARDLVLKLFRTTKEMIKTAMFAEMAIVYGNRYRNEENDLEKYLTYAEKLFYKGEYQKSLEITINSLNRIERGIYDKLLNLYSDENNKANVIE
ncbi:MAG: septation ring formation regulator EzrA [Bacilli bacterium]|nr:septation ring formation regulator EzrA [Bacilli bacterium]